MATPDQDVRNRKINPEARMELKEHLREFRDRLIKAAIATVIAAIIGTVFLYQPFIEMISAPLQQINAETGRNANLNYGSVASPFDQLLKVGMYIGLVIASPRLAVPGAAIPAAGTAHQGEEVSLRLPHRIYFRVCLRCRHFLLHPPRRGLRAAEVHPRQRK